MTILNDLLAVVRTSLQALAVRDKAFTKRSCTALPSADRTLSVPVPTDLASDLHRLWALSVHRFRVSLLQLRIPTAPTVESLPALASETKETP